MIEDVIAQNHVLVDSMNFAEGSVALSALRTILAGHSQAGAFAQLLGVEFQELANGHCRASLDVKHHLLNPHGIAHGGVAFSLADSACGGAALSMIGQPRMVTQDIQIRYHGPARPGKIVAEADVIHFGQRTMTTQCLVKQDEKIIASVTATFAILSDHEVAALRSGID